jgi:serpin B
LTPALGRIKLSGVTNLFAQIVTLFTLNGCGAKFSLATLFAVVTVLSGCSSGEKPTTQPGDPDFTARAIAPNSADDGSLAHANSDFALELYARMRTRQGNLVFSPYGISAALAMTYAGARGETEAEMARTLCLPFGQDRVHPAFARLRRDFGNTANDSLELRIANRIWTSDETTLAGQFLRTTRDHYFADVGHVRLPGDLTAARDQINAWINEQTHGKIAEAIPPEALDPRTVLVLTTAIYFKAQWQELFNEHATKPADFHVGRQKTVEVPMMHALDDIGLHELASTEMVTLLDLGLRGARGEFSMLVLLPNESDGLPALERELTTENLDRWIASLKRHTNDVFLPRFRIDSNLNLRPLLEAMGMRQAFAPNTADLTGISPNGKLWMDQTVHAAVVSVDEKGVEAAAATAHGLITALGDDERPIVFRADHPFIFLIRHKATGSILFLGRLVDPSDRLE